MSKFGRLFPLLCLFWSQTDPNPPLFYKFLTKIVILFILCSYLPIIMKMHHASDCFSFFTLMLRQSPQAAVVPPPKKKTFGRYLRRYRFFVLRELIPTTQSRYSSVHFHTTATSSQVQDIPQSPAHPQRPDAVTPPPNRKTFYLHCCPSNSVR